jgi:hypothetical protein
VPTRLNYYVSDARQPLRDGVDVYERVAVKAHTGIDNRQPTFAIPSYYQRSRLNVIFLEEVGLIADDERAVLAAPKSLKQLFNYVRFSWGRRLDASYQDVAIKANRYPEIRVLDPDDFCHPSPRALLGPFVPQPSDAARSVQNVADPKSLTVPAVPSDITCRDRNLVNGTPRINLTAYQPTPSNPKQVFERTPSRCREFGIEYQHKSKPPIEPQAA